MARFPGTPRDDILDGTNDDDVFIGRGGRDAIIGRGGDDLSVYNVSSDGADRTNLGAGTDSVRVKADDPGQVRLSFTSAEVGNGDALDSDTLANQDGRLAVRLKAEDENGVQTGPVSRYDDEGISFVAGAGVTFDVRDLVSGTQRGDDFKVVTLGRSADETLEAVRPNVANYINGGLGSDDIDGGSAGDFLVGGRGSDRLAGLDGSDSLLGGAGKDVLIGGRGKDTAIVNLSTDSIDRVDLGVGSDAVNVSANEPGQVRLTFTSAEVGNATSRDSDTAPSQDGGLAVRLELEDGSGALSGPTSRYDDEGITFVAGDGLSFDVRDLVSGAQRGDTFEVVSLGTSGNNVLSAVLPDSPYYFNGGQGDDQVTGGSANDFLVGGLGLDTLSGGVGDDKFIGGGGNDTVGGGAGTDTAIYSSNFDDVTFTTDGGTVTVVSADGTDTYTSVERFQFADRTVTIDDFSM